MTYENLRDTKYWDIRDSKIYHMYVYIRDVGTQNIVIRKTRNTLCVETQDMGRYEK